MKRFSPATLTLLMLLIVGGLVLAYIGKKLLAREDKVEIDPLIDVPMAIADLEPGTKITKAHIAIGRLLQSKLTRDLVKTDRVLVDRIVKTKIKAAQPISTMDLYAPNDGPPLKVGTGMRAVTVALADGVAAVDGLVKAGDFVDIHFVPAYYRDAARNGGMIMTLFKGVQVVAMNRNMTGSIESSRGQNSVTLEMTSDHANVLLLASRKGQLNLTYTPDGKAENQFVLRDQDRAYLDEILGLKAPEEVKSEKKRPTVTEIYAGHQRSLSLFKDGLRGDRWAIERAPLGRAAGYGYGGNGDYGYGDNGGKEPPPPPMDRPRDDYGGYGGGYGGGNGGGGYGNGFYSVPQGDSAGTAPGAGAGANGAGANGGQGGAPGGNFGGQVGQAEGNL